MGGRAGIVCKCNGGKMRLNPAKREEAMRGSGGAKDGAEKVGNITFFALHEFTRMEFLRGTIGLAFLTTASSTLAAARNKETVDFLTGEGMPYEAFDRLTTSDLGIAGSIIRVGFAPGDFALPKARYLARIGAAASAVADYYGHFPVGSVRFLMVPVDGDGVRGGTTWGYRGAAIRILFGRDTDQQALDRDWIMTHEMVHLALPVLDRRYNWLSEGLAVYVEPIARVQAGDLTAAAIWRDMKRDMARDLPRAGDRGLDYDSAWGRTYRGGALFCLLADIRIR
jgi:hypothetical protein